MSLQGKKIILGISGSIAAYKAAMLTRLMVKAGAEVQVLMTTAATQFITPLTLSTLSKRPVHSEMFSEEGWNNHVELGIWADAMLIAPATASTLSKMASAQCDSILLATYLSAKCPVFFAPAMDLDMWAHPANVDNVSKLQSYGNHYLPVENGELASGLHGKGRMTEPEKIVQTLSSFFQDAQALINTDVLITAGPTFEPLDPVRFLGNRSSGKMGIAIAQAAARHGAKVKLILGPTHLDIHHPAVEVIRVQTAEEMFQAAKKHWKNARIGILAAAVADYRPKSVAQQKIKKGGEPFKLELERTQDIAAFLGKQKKKSQVLIGFALETNNELENAKSKLTRKNFDFIVLNSLQEEGAGFQHDTNKVSFVFSGNKQQNFELKSKLAVGEDILKASIHVLQEKTAK